MATPFSLPPERPQLAALVADAQQGRGNREQERTPASEREVANEVLKIRGTLGIRPLWKPARVLDVITELANRGEPWPTVRRAALVMARDPHTKYPSRLLQDRYWRSLQPTVSGPSRPDWCRDPRCDREKHWHDWHGDNPASVPGLQRIGQGGGPVLVPGLYRLRTGQDRVMAAAHSEWSVPAMAACAVAIRADWDPDQTTGALLAIQGSGEWSPCRALSLLARTLADPDGSPRNLLAAVQDPRRRNRSADPEAVRLYIAQTRAALNRPRTGGRAA